MTVTPWKGKPFSGQAKGEKHKYHVEAKFHIFTLAEESSQEVSIPPDIDKRSISTAGDLNFSLAKTLKISSTESNPNRVNKKPCKYIRAKQACPFGSRCHFRHDITVKPSDTRHQELTVEDSEFTSKETEELPPAPLSSPNGGHGQPAHKNHPPRRRRRPPAKNAPKHTSSDLTQPPTIDDPSHTHTHVQHKQSKQAVKPQPKELASEEKHSKTSPVPNSRETFSSESNSPTFITSSSQQRQQYERSRGPPELVLGSFIGSSLNRPSVQRPRAKKTAKTPSASELREVELQQLEARFPDCVLVEKGREKIVYSFSYKPADPDWDFSFYSLSFEVSFPGEYPLQPLSTRVCAHKNISSEVLDHINLCLEGYLTAEGFQRGTLMFRPFLHWLDKSFVSILKDALSGFKQPAEDILDKESFSEESSEEVDTSEEEDEEEAASAVVTLPVKAGTEIRLVGLNLSVSIATVTFTSPTVVVACGRCKKQVDIKVKPESTVSGSCNRCQCVFTVVYHPTLVHASTSTLGFMDLIECSVVDLVLIDCTLNMVCLDCGHDNQTKSMLYGQSKDLWCRRCHSKLSVMAEQCRFVKHQPAAIKVGGEGSALTGLSKTARLKEPLIKLGYPLPDNGTCSHYKKSRRWLRFPCCGKAYPCDMCHDQSETHTMERAKRMICGTCSLEQVYSSEKPCTGCGCDMTSTKRTAHWEGGKGCRNKTKMDRRDKRKHANSSLKMTSQKAKRVGKQEKS